MNSFYDDTISSAAIKFAFWAIELCVTWFSQPGNSEIVAPDEHFQGHIFPFFILELNK